MDDQEFEAHVARAWDNLPPQFRARLRNVEVVVEEWPDHETLKSLGIRDALELQAYYHGIPLTQRTVFYGLVAPDLISVYRQPILRACRDDEEVIRTITRVVRHEVAHAFGISDDRLRELGAY